MKRLLLLLMISASGFAWAGRNGPWSREKAWEWHNAQPWLRGANYMPASAANRIDQWQSYGSEERFREVESEMALAEQCGFNAMRILILEQGFCVWLDEHDAFMANFERTLAIMAKHGVRAMVVLGNDCSRPKRIWQRPKLGPQPYDVGYHGGRKQTQHGSFPGECGYLMMDDEEYRVKFYAMCRELMTKYAHDRRVVIWNLWNEPGAGNRGEKSADLIKGLFRLAWEIDPDQPLCADTWSQSLWKLAKGEYPSPIEKLVLDLSDIISYHGYCSLDTQVKVCDNLARMYGRPLYNTEWLLRGHGCEFADNYAFFQQRKIGAFNWGFVNGKYQTHEPYEPMWRNTLEYGSSGDPTKWFHDLFRPSHHPWDPYEIAAAKNLNAEADLDREGKSLRKRIAAKHRIIGEDIWHGFRRIRFDFEGREAAVVEPSVKAADGMPWTWTIQWWDCFVERTGVEKLLRRGWHHAWIDGFEFRGDDRGLKLFNDFQDYLVSELGFAKKTNLIGMSWGGFFASRYAAVYPGKVAKLYLDGAVLDLASLPEMKMKTDAEVSELGPWAVRIRAGNEWKKEMPVNLVDRIANQKIPVLLVYGADDQAVDPATSSELFAARYREAGGGIEVDRRDGYGHHPHGFDLDRTGRIVDFFTR